MSAPDPDKWFHDLQAELVALPKSDEKLGQLPVIYERNGDIGQDVDKALGLLTGGTPGKLGACIILLQLQGGNSAKAARGGQMKAQPVYRVLEEPLLNDGANGFGIPALEICKRLIAVVALYYAEGLATALTTLDATLVPVVDEKASVAYEVQFECTEARTARYEVVAMPTLSVKTGAAPQVITITCATAGADIYYTLDNSHPWEGNPSAVLYSAPVNVAAAGQLRARAFKDGMLGSGTASGNYT
ncbi:MAG TPA: chitobiase/beta-hexosaminidase C-terminal domain-containing protein [Verrucomicrobiae bacterium]|nr:chitobiase/beta-hexosaminidase C-terminal domain-containing protein [Verrucomicrobiae bacterium]